MLRDIMAIFEGVGLEVACRHRVGEKTHCREHGQSKCAYHVISWKDACAQTHTAGRYSILRFLWIFSTDAVLLCQRKKVKVAKHQGTLNSISSFVFMTQASATT